MRICFVCGSAELCKHRDLGLLSYRDQKTVRELVINTYSETDSQDGAATGYNSNALSNQEIRALFKANKIPLVEKTPKKPVDANCGNKSIHRHNSREDKRSA